MMTIKKEDLYEKKHADLVLEKGLEVCLDELYEAKLSSSVLIARMVVVTAQKQHFKS
jgi:hypothetical protein